MKFSKTFFSPKSHHWDEDPSDVNHHLLPKDRWLFWKLKPPLNDPVVVVRTRHGPIRTAYLYLSKITSEDWIRSLSRTEINLSYFNIPLTLFYPNFFKCSWIFHDFRWLQACPLPSCCSCFARGRPPWWPVCLHHSSYPARWGNWWIGQSIKSHQPITNETVGTRCWKMTWRLESFIAFRSAMTLENSIVRLLCL